MVQIYDEFTHFITSYSKIKAKQSMLLTLLVVDGGVDSLSMRNFKAPFPPSYFHV